MNLLLIILLSSPTQIDKAGRDAFNALRDYQTIYLVHKFDQDIEVKLAEAYECIWDSYRYVNNRKDEKVISLMKHQHQIILDLVRLSYLPDLNKAMKKVQLAFEKLFALFFD